MAQSVGTGIRLLFHDHGTWRGSGQQHAPGRTLSTGKSRYPLYTRLGGPQGRSGRTDNLAPPGFDPRIAQSVVCCYTDWATGPTRKCTIKCLLSLNIFQHERLSWRLKSAAMEGWNFIYFSTIPLKPSFHFLPSSWGTRFQHTIKYEKITILIFYYTSMIFGRNWVRVFWIDR